MCPDIDPPKCFPSFILIASGLSEFSFQFDFVIYYLRLHWQEHWLWLCAEFATLFLQISNILFTSIWYFDYKISQWMHKKFSNFPCWFSHKPTKLMNTTSHLIRVVCIGNFILKNICIMHIYVLINIITMTKIIEIQYSCCMYQGMYTESTMLQASEKCTFGTQGVITALAVNNTQKEVITLRRRFWRKARVSATNM